MRIQRAITEKIRVDPTFEERWESEDQGVITSWEVGRLRRESTEERWVNMVENARVLEFPRTGLKKGSAHYLAQLQGLRNQDLDVEV